jgi:hypothetical protein
MKKHISLSILLVFISSALFCDTIDLSSLEKGPNYPSVLDIQNPKKRDLYISGKFTYWQPLEEMTELASAFNSSSSTFKYVRLDPNFQPGFKIGAGSAINYDNWDFFVEYTYFRSETKIEEDLSDFESWTQTFWMPKSITNDFTNGSINYAKGLWDISLDKLTLSLLRSYYVGTKLKFQTHFGLTSYWIKQNYNAQYFFNIIGSDSVRLITDIKTEPLAIGPRAGVCLDYVMTKNFTLIADLFLSLTYNVIKVSGDAVNIISEITLGPPIDLKSIKHTPVNFHPEMALGLKWGKYFAKHGLFFELAALYEMQVYNNQNYLAPYLQSIGVIQVLTLVPPGNLFFHGPTFTLRLDF